MIMVRCKGDWGGVKVFRKCDSPQGGVIGIRKVHRLRERHDDMGKCKGVWQVVTAVKNCGSPQ